ncbi:MAG: FkbM family methyltransferase [Acidobacteria bacterium]|nr:FkbM family methyltransferase [Acidobacteriota bacterium]
MKPPYRFDNGWAKLLREVAPYGLIRALDWKRRFGTVGLAPYFAWKAAASLQMRQALVTSRVELLPPAMRSGLNMVVDVGANLGQWVSAFRKFVPVKRVEAFEPNPATHQRLAALSGDWPGLHLHNIALGEEPGEQTLYINYESGLSSLLVASENLKDFFGDTAVVVNEITVPVTTLDRVIAPDVMVDLLKLDVQGFEARVIRGGGKETLKRTRLLLTELLFQTQYHGEDSFVSLFRLLMEDFGFRLWDICPLERAGGRAIWADALFVNPAFTIPAGHS